MAMTVEVNGGVGVVVMAMELDGGDGVVATIGGARAPTLGGPWEVDRRRARSLSAGGRKIWP